MSKLRSRLTFANVMSVIAVFIALGGTGYAAFKLPKNSVGTKQLKKNSVTTAKIKKRAVTAAKVKDGTLTGQQINLAKLGTVPTANTANIANSLAAPEGWHEVGAPGEPVFQNSWKNGGAQHETVGFYKDQEGVVHLKGLAVSGTFGPVFQLPAGYRPASGRALEVAVHCGGGAKCGGASEVGTASIVGPGILPEFDGAVVAPSGAIVISLDGIAFRAES